MDAPFWLERWEQNRIGFHRAEENPLLLRYWAELGLDASASVLVPLCGKSRDLWWLRTMGHPVTGVELSPIAVESFFNERGSLPERRELGKFQVYDTQNLTLFCGDFFDITPAELPPMDAVYDRAALIALPADLRRRYASHVTTLLAGRSSVLLVTLEYVSGSMEGPPFSVTEDEVHSLYAPAFDIKRLHTGPVEETRAEFAARGLHQMRDAVYRLRRRSS
jgi:thiopurine S-methyltransferase